MSRSMFSSTMSGMHANSLLVLSPARISIFGALVVDREDSLARTVVASVREHHRASPRTGQGDAHRCLELMEAVHPHGVPLHAHRHGPVVRDQVTIVLEPRRGDRSPAHKRPMVVVQEA